MDTATAIRRLELHTRYVDDDVGGVALVLTDLLAALGEDERRAVLRHAYWRMPDVPTSALQAVGGGEEALRCTVGRGPVVGSCPRCTRVIRARSRDDVDVPASTPCAECRAGPTRARPGRLRRPGFTWEFDAAPRPWRPTSVTQVVAGERRWAEHYPAEPTWPAT